MCTPTLHLSLPTPKSQQTLLDRTVLLKVPFIKIDSICNLTKPQLSQGSDLIRTTIAWPAAAVVRFPPREITSLACLTSLSFGMLSAGQPSQSVSRADWETEKREMLSREIHKHDRLSLYLLSSVPCSLTGTTGARSVHVPFQTPARRPKKVKNYFWSVLLSHL